ncbi:MAG TPA: hypothetical protein VN224_16810, partial [Xanthomonadales bacterium]|nr:hypothetical protein [Xanthomonadales bacterium]
MPSGLRSIAALLLAALPVAAHAEGVNFTVPDHYLVAPRPSNGDLPPVYRIWDRQLDGVRHSIVVSATPTTSDLAAIMDATVASLAARHATDVSRSDAGPLCGAPSVRIAYAFPQQLAFVFRYAVVRGRLLIASYAHPAGTTADPGALSSLDTLCTGIHQPGGPPGWTIVAPYQPNRSAWRPSTGSRTLLAQLAGVASKTGADRVSQPYNGQGTVVVDRRDVCGAISIRRVTANLDDARVLEF